MVKYKDKKMLMRRIRSKLVLQGRSVLQFCRDSDVTYDLYKKYMEDGIGGKSRSRRRRAVKTERLIKAIVEFLGDDESEDKKTERRAA